MATSTGNLPVCASLHGVSWGRLVHQCAHQIILLRKRAHEVHGQLVNQMDGATIEKLEGLRCALHRYRGFVPLLWSVMVLLCEVVGVRARCLVFFSLFSELFHSIFFFFDFFQNAMVDRHMPNTVTWVTTNRSLIHSQPRRTLSFRSQLNRRTFPSKGKKKGASGMFEFWPNGQYVGATNCS